MSMKHWMAGLLCAALLCIAWPGTAGDVRKSAEASMLVTGWIDVMPDGTVHDYTIDQQEKVPSIVRDLIQTNVPTWKFKVVLKDPVIERARMNLRIVVKRVDNQHDSIQIASAFFGDGQGMGSDYVSHKNGGVPSYPMDAIDKRVSGTVYMLVRVNRQGLVQDAFAEQVNLTGFSNVADMPRDRNLLAHAALEGARKWTFNPPTTGPHAADAYWDTRIPVTFDLHRVGTPTDTYGKWEVYIPGPRTPAPWLQQAAPSVQGSDAIPAGSMAQADEHLSLMTPLAGT